MRPLGWSDLPGWDRDDHTAAWSVFATTSQTSADGAPRRRFETLFEPVEVSRNAHFTGYYEPELDGSRRPTSAFPAPLHAMPKGIPKLWHPRSEIIARDLLRGHELAWVESRIEAFLAQVQGSVRLRTPEGPLRLGFAGKNGHPYRSIGRELVRRGVAPPEQLTPEVIRAWCRAHPDQVTALLNHNPSYVFFRVLDLPPDTGPIGAMAVPVTPGRTLAVDPEVIPLGSPVWVECPGWGARLMVAQDTGSAIKGVGRGDIFIGSGPEAGRVAGRINTRGRMVWLRRRA